MRVNIDLVAAYIRGGDAVIVGHLRDAALNRLTKLKLPAAGRAFRGDSTAQQINEAAILGWIASVQPDDKQNVKLLQRLVVSANQRLGK